ncbi:MAG: hypothetical protein F6J93_32050 [Oscillatoria sp. SIO1A7]|nr:hypothetical protein [Oscillatoria sp. SIO1A7]
MQYSTTDSGNGRPSQLETRNLRSHRSFRRQQSDYNGPIRGGAIRENRRNSPTPHTPHLTPYTTPYTLLPINNFF